MIGDAAIVMAAPNGARRTTADHPQLPTTPEALANTASECLSAGAAALHMHVRDSEQRHSLDPGLYREAISAVAEAAPEMIVQVTSEAAGVFSAREQAEAMRALSPEAMSVALREMTPDADAEAHAAEFYAWAAGTGAHLQHILYDPAEVTRLRELLDKRVIPGGPLALLFVLGKYTPPTDGRPQEAAPFIKAAEGLGASITFCAFGRNELACLAEGMRLGAHARVGFENNLHLPDGRLASRNADLVALVAAEAKRTGRGPATPSEARTILGLREPQQTKRTKEKGVA